MYNFFTQLTLGVQQPFYRLLRITVGSPIPLWWIDSDSFGFQKGFPVYRRIHARDRCCSCKGTHLIHGYENFSKCQPQDFHVVTAVFHNFLLKVENTSPKGSVVPFEELCSFRCAHRIGCVKFCSWKGSYLKFVSKGVELVWKIPLFQTRWEIKRFR